MRKVVIIILALVVALGALPVTFACYNGGWGNWHHFWHPHQTVYCCNNQCNLIFTSADASDNEDTFTEPKEVAETNAWITCCGEKLKITITNAYPGYHGIVDFCVKNIGSLDATLVGISTDPPSPVYYQIDLTGEVQEETVISPCETKCGQLIIYGIPQLEEAQNQCFTFTIDLNFECGCNNGGCETAFGHNCCYATCFSEFGFSRWGWTNGLLAPRWRSYNLGLYAGAGSCNPFDGDRVGHVTVYYNGSAAFVVYNTFYGYKMSETHLYVGNDPLPTKNGNDTVAPGQYSYKHENLNRSTDWYRVTGLSGNIYIVAHAVVCR